VPLNYTTHLGAFDNLKNNLALRVRRRTFDLFMRECAPTPHARVADFGVSGHREHPAHYFFELWYPYRNKLTAIGRAAENANWMPQEFPGLAFMEADLRTIPVPDNYFDAGICNAVLEHAGTYEEQRRLAREVCRACRVVMFTTPNRYFPVELHTFLPFVHWLPDQYFRGILRRIGQKEFAEVENLNLLDAGTFSSLFPAERQNRIIKLGWPMLRSNLVCVSSAATLRASAAAAPGD